MLAYYFMMAQASTTMEAAVRAFAEEASSKDFRWWFAIIFAIMIASGTIVFRMLIKQIADQRLTNADITKEFITNMKEDRLKQMVLLERVTIVLEKLEEDKKLQILMAAQSDNLPPGLRKAIREHNEKEL